MKLLKAIADTHPQNIFHGVLHWQFEIFLSDCSYHADRINEIYVRAIDKKPDCVREEGFWSVIGKEIIQRIQHEQNKRPHSLEKDRTKEILRDLEIGRRIWVSQLEEIEKNNYGLLFLEGIKQPLGIYATKLGIEVVYLDRGVDISDIILDEYGGPTYGAQLARENRWVEVISGFSERINNSLLIVGANHVDGKYWLEKKLLEKDIKLIKILDYGALKDEVTQDPRFSDN